MTRAATILSIVVSLIVCTGLLQNAVASDDHEQARQLVEQGAILPLETILKNLPEPVARVLKVELEQEHGQWAYEIEILTRNSEVKEYTFDANNGRLLKMEHDN